MMSPRKKERAWERPIAERGGATSALLEDLIIQSASNNAKLTRLITDGGGSGHAGDQSDGKGWKMRFPPMQQKFILFASAVDKNSVPEEPCQPSRSSKGASKLPPKVRRVQEERNTGGGLSHVGASLQHVLLRGKPEL